MIRIMLVDDQRFARLGFQLMLDDASDIVVTAQSADGRSAIETLEQVAVQHRPLPNVILMDVRMPGMDGIAATAELRKLSKPLSASPDAGPPSAFSSLPRTTRTITPLAVSTPEPAASCSRTSPSTTSSTRFTPSPTVTMRIIIMPR